jgi:hypothetical protein
MTGWAAAARGVLYETSRSEKTHANMGNLFGWIYGDESEDFKEDTWDRYVSTLPINQEAEEDAFDS